jgi:hypothetical protein
MTLMMAAREQAGGGAPPSAAIIDSQSVKTPNSFGGSGGIRGCDVGKKGVGRERQRRTDPLGRRQPAARR